MADIYKINKYLKKLLDPNDIADYTINGIQVETENNNISNVTFAVDASISSINESITNNSDLLIVHHGIIWNKPLPIEKAFRKRIELFLNNDLGLIAFHLPLDRHEKYGNNAQILKKIGSGILNPFGYYKGINIGWKLTLDENLNIDKICNKLGIDIDKINYLDFGSNNIRKIASVSGSGGHHFEEAINEEIDLFITGDAEHTLYHASKENSINVLFAGHYFTETFGIKAIKKLIEDKFKINTQFLDIPTGL